LGADDTSVGAGPVPQAATKASRGRSVGRFMSRLGEASCRPSVGAGVPRENVPRFRGVA
jgi:hypothetical protein